MSGTERTENPNAPQTSAIPECVAIGKACEGLKAEAAARTQERAQNDELRAENERLHAEVTLMLAALKAFIDPDNAPFITSCDAAAIKITEDARAIVAKAEGRPQ